MRERPIQDLVDGLVALGVDAKCMLKTGCPPVEIIAKGLKPGKVLETFHFPHNTSHRAPKLSQRKTTFLIKQMGGRLTFLVKVMLLTES